MRKDNRRAGVRLALLLLAAPVWGLWAQSPDAKALTQEQKEEFLLKAKVIKTQEAAKGVTGTLRATLSDGTVTHDASIQKIDSNITDLDTPYGRMRLLKDSWEYDVAAYKLGKMLGVTMIPVSVERRYGGSHSAFTWWVDDVLIDEEQRQKRKEQPPNPDRFNQQMHVMHVFDQLIANIDRNQGNMLFDKSWQMWMIDHSRSFINNPNLFDPKAVAQCDANLLEKLKALDEAAVVEALKPYVQKGAVHALMQRRDKIVKILDAKGPSALFHMLEWPK